MSDALQLEIRIRDRIGSFALDVEMSSPLGGVTAFFGPSGSGKTTVINAIAGLTRPRDAFIRVGDRVLNDTGRGVFVKPHERRVGYVFQDARLFPHLSVTQNLNYGRNASRPDATRAEDIIDLLGISHLLDRGPVGLSGGEAQRVAIGRALISAPDIMLMDEPLAALDQARREEILPYLEALRRLTSTQIIYVTHSMAEVARLADTIAFIRAGKVVRAGPASEILSDAAAVPEVGVREAGAVLQAAMDRPDAGDGLSALKTSAGILLLPRLDAPKGAIMRVRILATDIILSKDKPDGLSALNILPATISEIREGTGPGVAIALMSGQDKLVARITRRSARILKLEPGARCFAVIKSVSVAPGDIGGPTG